MTAENRGNSAKRRLVRRHRLEPSHDHVEYAVPWALLRRRRFGLGKHLGIDLGLEGPEDVRLAGEIAAKVGKAHAAALRDRRKGHGFPPTLGCKLERGNNGFV